MDKKYQPRLFQSSQSIYTYMCKLYGVDLAMAAASSSSVNHPTSAAATASSKVTAGFPKLCQTTRDEIIVINGVVDKMPAFTTYRIRRSENKLWKKTSIIECDDINANKLRNLDLSFYLFICPFNARIWMIESPCHA